jgi:hypothetical protein
MRWRRSSGSALSRSSVEPPAWRRHSVTASIAQMNRQYRPEASAASEIPREGTATRRRTWDGQHGRAGDVCRAADPARGDGDEAAGLGRPARSSRRSRARDGDEAAATLPEEGGGRRLAAPSGSRPVRVSTGTFGIIFRDLGGSNCD